MLKGIKASFECHQGTEIEFSPGLTAICGVNDSGKSSLNRALRWVTTNTPKGDGYLPWWGGGATVSLETDKGTINRIRTKKENFYQIGSMTLKALGNSVPDEVYETAGLNELNIQKQVNQYYILNESPGNIAKMINDVAGISESDDAIKTVSQIIRDTKREIKEGKELLEQKQAALSGLGWTAGAKDKMLELKNSEYHLQQTVVTLASAQTILFDLKTVEDALLQYPDLDQLVRVAELLDVRVRFLEDVRYSKGVLQGMLRELEEIDLEKYGVLNEVGDLDRFSVELGELEVRRLVIKELQFLLTGLGGTPDMSWLDEVSLERMIQIMQTLEFLVEEDNALELTKEALEAAKKSYAEALQTLARAEEELAKIPKCPECGRELDEKHSSHS